MKETIYTIPVNEAFLILAASVVPLIAFPQPTLEKLILP